MVSDTSHAIRILRRCKFLTVTTVSRPFFIMQGNLIILSAITTGVRIACVPFKAKLLRLIYSVQIIACICGSAKAITHPYCLRSHYRRYWRSLHSEPFDWHEIILNLFRLFGWAMQFELHSVRHPLPLTDMQDFSFRLGWYGASSTVSCIRPRLIQHSTSTEIDSKHLFWSSNTGITCGTNLVLLPSMRSDGSKTSGAWPSLSCHLLAFPNFVHHLFIWYCFHTVS